MHDHNLVHMDIKPDNIFISFDDICKLGDFGLVLDLTKVYKKNMDFLMFFIFKKLLDLIVYHFLGML